MNKRCTLRGSGTDWQRVDALRDEEIDLSESPEIAPQMFARAVVRKGLEPVAAKRQARSVSMPTC